MPSSQVSRLPRLNQHCPLHSYTFCSAQQAIRCCLWWLQVSFHERPLEIERRYIMVDEELERRRGFSFWSILYIYCSIEPFDLFCVLYIYYIFFSLIPLLHRFFPPMEVSYQETSNSLMGALLIHDIVNAKSKATPTSENPIKCVIVQRWIAENLVGDKFHIYIYICRVCSSGALLWSFLSCRPLRPLRLFASGSFHFGIWRQAFKIGSIGEAATILFYLQQYGFLAVLGVASATAATSYALLVWGTELGREGVHAFLLLPVALPFVLYSKICLAPFPEIKCQGVPSLEIIG